jgi:hypothetical protein
MKKNSVEYISWLLTMNDHAVERAIVVLYNRQTSDEQTSQQTRHRNGRGFNSSDAHKGSYMANYILKGNHLSGKWLNDARIMALKYVNQLVEEATIKQERQMLAMQRDIAIERETIQMENA